MARYNYNLGLCFYEIAFSFPDNVALSYPENSSFRYSELNSLSNQIARFFINKGIQKNQVVALLNNKSINAYASMIACMKCGIIYTNIDFSSPWERTNKILSTCNPVLILDDGTQSELIEHIKKHTSIEVLDIHSAGFSKAIVSLDASNLKETTSITGNDPAYIMFTSGSTGFPKGAVMSHSNVINFIHWGQTTFDITPSDIFTNANPIYFDNSVFDFYTSLFSGAALVPISIETAKDPKSLVTAVNESGCTVWFSVPSLLVYLLTTKALTRNDFKSVRRIIFGGEGFPKTKLKQLFDLYSHRIALFNVYGPTECTCICSSYLVSERDFEKMNELTTLGYLAPNFSYVLLPLDEFDPNTGELCLIGPNVGLGYYNDPERSAAAFIQNSDKKYAERMYKTGDVVQKDAKGHLHFKGRVDNQIKHMGYRIELEEIEAAFNSIPYVNEVGVVYEKINAELGQIKAFVNISVKDKVSADLMKEVKNILQTYMNPRSIEIMSFLPKNQNGKVDRKQLLEIKK